MRLIMSREYYGFIIGVILITIFFFVHEKQGYEEIFSLTSSYPELFINHRFCQCEPLNLSPRLLVLYRFPPPE
jgi:hypothetical protein